MLSNAQTLSRISTSPTTNNAPNDKATTVDKWDARLREIEEQLENLKPMLAQLIESDRAKSSQSDRAKSLETDQEKPLETDHAKSLETDQEKPLETNHAKSLETDQEKPLETDHAKSLEAEQEKTSRSHWNAADVQAATNHFLFTCSPLSFCLSPPQNPRPSA